MTNQDRQGDFQKIIERKGVKEKWDKERKSCIKKDIKTKSYRKLRSRKKRESKKKKENNEVGTKREGQKKKRDGEKWRDQD